MLTLNADTHDIFKDLHRPDPKRDADKQDKRMVVILNENAYGAWLDAPVEKAMDFVRQYPAATLHAVPEVHVAEEKKLF